MENQNRKRSPLRFLLIILGIGLVAVVLAVRWRDLTTSAREGTRSAFLYDTYVATVRVTGPLTTGNSKNVITPTTTAPSAGMQQGAASNIGLGRTVTLPVPRLSVTVPDPLIEHRLQASVYNTARTKLIETLKAKSVAMATDAKQTDIPPGEKIDLGFMVDVREYNGAIGLKVHLNVTRPVYSSRASVEPHELVIVQYNAEPGYAWVAPKDIEPALNALINELADVFAAQWKRTNAPEPAGADKEKDK